MASEMPSRDVKLSDLAELINSLDKSQLPENLGSKAYRNTYVISTSSLPNIYHVSILPFELAGFIYHRRKSSI